MGGLPCSAPEFTQRLLGLFQAKLHKAAAATLSKTQQRTIFTHQGQARPCASPVNASVKVHGRSDRSVRSPFVRHELSISSNVRPLVSGTANQINTKATRLTVA